MNMFNLSLNKFYNMKNYPCIDKYTKLHLKIKNANYKIGITNLLCIYCLYFC